MTPSDTMQDNAQYWIDRHKQKQGEIASVGDIRKSEQENTTLYAYKKRQIFEALRALQLTDLNGKCILDAGCGIGLLSEMFWILGANVSGLDVSLEALELAKTRVPDGNFKKGVLSAFSFKRKFDLVLCADVLYHIIDDTAWKAALMALKQHVMPGGYCIIIEQLKSEISFPAPHVHFRTKELYLEATKPIGLKLLNVASVHPGLLVFQS
jgi:2-polyprenyl-3-methyl-5-hydroxy-6-metoxy-1,4-benzoquinol methylase